MEAAVVVIVLMGAIFAQAAVLYVVRDQLKTTRATLAERERTIAEMADFEASAKAVCFYREWASELHKSWWSSVRSSAAIGDIIKKLSLPPPKNYIPRYDITCEPAPLAKPATPKQVQERRSKFHIVK